jgi:hypothetical protein
MSLWSGEVVEGDIKAETMFRSDLFPIILASHDSFHLLLFIMTSLLFRILFHLSPTLSSNFGHSFNKRLHNDNGFHMDEAAIARIQLIFSWLLHGKGMGRRTVSNYDPANFIPLPELDIDLGLGLAIK